MSVPRRDCNCTASHATALLCWLGSGCTQNLRQRNPAGLVPARRWSQVAPISAMFARDGKLPRLGPLLADGLGIS